MKKKIYLSFMLFLSAFAGYSQGSQVNSTVQTSPGGYYGVYGTLTFNAGYIVTPRANPATSSVYFTAGSAYAGSKDASHVDGYAEKEGTTAFTFPVGNGTKLRTAGISAPAASSRFQAAYWFSNPNSASLPAGGPFLVANLGTGVSAVSNIEYWDINGASAVNITLSWDAASALVALTSNTLANLVIVGYNATSGKWENLGAAGGTTGTLAATVTITANGVTPNSYVAYTFASAAPAGLLLSVKVLLQGPMYATGNTVMTTYLNDNGILETYAKQQPYSVAPFSYAGTESVPAGFFAAHPNVTDWVLVELRSSSDATSVISRKAGLLMKDGTVTTTDGTSPLSFTGPAAGSYYVSVTHRNHLTVVSNVALGLSGTVTLFDFTTGLAKALDNGNGNSMVVSAGKWTMWAGDFIHDDIIDGLDRSNTSNETNVGYSDELHIGDINLDGYNDGLDNSLQKNNSFIGPFSPLF